MPGPHACCYLGVSIASDWESLVVTLVSKAWFGVGSRAFVFRSTPFFVVRLQIDFKRSRAEDYETCPKEYDIAIVTVPMALLLWRLFAQNNNFNRTILEFFFFMFAFNSIVANDGTY
jgi:hypothetical protein